MGKNARYLIYNNFKEYIKKVKYYTKNYANLDGIKYKSDLNLIENPPEKLNIEPPVEKDFMPKIEKEYDKNIKEEDINIIASTIFANDILLKIKNTDFVLDICLKLREYIIKYRDFFASRKRAIPCIKKRADSNGKVRISPNPRFLTATRPNRISFPSTVKPSSL